MKKAEKPKKNEANFDKLACFNDNYFVFGIKGVKMPQITDIYLDKEEDMLEREQIIKFKQKWNNQNETNKNSAVFIKDNLSQSDVSLGSQQDHDMDFLNFDSNSQKSNRAQTLLPYQKMSVDVDLDESLEYREQDYDLLGQYVKKKNLEQSMSMTESNYNAENQINEYFEQQTFQNMSLDYDNADHQMNERNERSDSMFMEIRQPGGDQ